MLIKKIDWEAFSALPDFEEIQNMINELFF